MANKQYFSEPLSFTGIVAGGSCIGAADLDSAFTLIQPLAGIGLIIFSDTAPDVVTYPALKYFTWRKTFSGATTKDSFDSYFDAATGFWEALSTTDGARIQAKSIPITALNPGVGNALKIYQVSADGSSVQFASVGSLFSAGSIPVNSLVPPGAGYYFLASTASSSMWVSGPTAGGMISNIPISNLQISAVFGSVSILTTNTLGVNTWATSIPGTVLTSATVPPGAMQPGATDGMLLTISSGSATWKLPQPGKAAISIIDIVPAASGVPTLVAHGQNGTPAVAVSWVCVNLSVSYGTNIVVGSELPLETFMQSWQNGGGSHIYYNPLASLIINPTQVIAYFGPYSGGSPLAYNAYMTTDVASDPFGDSSRQYNLGPHLATDWKLRIRVFLQ